MAWKFNIQKSTQQYQSSSYYKWFILAITIQHTVTLRTIKIPMVSTDWTIIAITKLLTAFLTRRVNCPQYLRVRCHCHLRSAKRGKIYRPRESSFLHNTTHRESFPHIPLSVLSGASLCYVFVHHCPMSTCTLQIVPLPVWLFSAPTILPPKSSRLRSHSMS